MLGSKYASLLGAFGTPAHQVHAERVGINRLIERSPACTSVKLGVAVDSTNVKTVAAMAPSFEAAPESAHFHRGIGRAGPKLESHPCW